MNTQIIQELANKDEMPATSIVQDFYETEEVEPSLKDRWEQVPEHLLADLNIPGYPDICPLKAWHVVTDTGIWMIYHWYEEPYRGELTYERRSSMTNKDFYAFCRDHRKTEPDVHKREALQDVYRYMLECGVTKLGVSAYIQHQIEIERKPREAYTWIQNVFDGTSGIEQFGEELWR